jgi:hypothetical protein
MQNHNIDKSDGLCANGTSNKSAEKLEWTKPILEEFAITTATRNAGIINLDADHALDIS